MQSIFCKLRLITLSNLRLLLEQIKDLNTIDEYEQYIRDLQNAFCQINQQAIASRDRKHFLQEKINLAEALCSLADEQINILIINDDEDPINDSFILPLLKQFDMIKGMIAIAMSELVKLQETVAEYNLALQKINVRLSEAKGKLEALYVVEKYKMAREKATKALEEIDFESTLGMSNAFSSVYKVKLDAEQSLVKRRIKLNIQK